jgi:peptidoglycan/LPS O-acetylase OafA/YrhL
MRDVAQIGLQAVVASFLPLAIHAYGASPDATWRIASAAFFLLWGVGLGFAIRSRLNLDPAEFRIKRVRIAVNGTLNAGGAGLLLFNVLLGGPSSGARYVTAVLLLLAIAGLQFLSAAFSAPPDSPAAA